MKRILISLLVVVAAFAYFGAGGFNAPTSGQSEANAQSTTSESAAPPAGQSEANAQSSTGRGETAADAPSADAGPRVANDSLQAPAQSEANVRPDLQSEANVSPAASSATGLASAAYLTDRPEQLVRHSAMLISWNSALRLPNYVAWELNEARVNGDSKRADDFQPDPTVKDSPTWADYRSSGFDRGHMCPAADNKHSMQAQKECFYMTNMCPQTHKLNAGDWSELEQLCRRWAKKYGTIYIASGPIVKGYPKNKQPKNQRIGDAQVLVPDAFFKVVMRRGEYGAKAIGFICPNADQNRRPTDYAVSVDSVESLTGINFFNKLPKAEERKAESSFNFNEW